jgi:hypothetical protein
MEAKAAGSTSGIFKTHPPTSERLAKVKARWPDPAEAQGRENPHRAV